MLGGSFDPVHFGHLLIAERAAEAARLDRVLFIPAALAPHKRHRTPAPPAERLAMLRSAIRGNPRFAVSDLEIRRGGVSYSVDTLRELRRHHPSAKLFWILGADAFAILSTWRSLREVTTRTSFLVAARPASPRRKPPIDSLQVKYFDAPLVDISSSEIRDRARRGLSLRYLVPEAVARHICRKGLYSR